MRITGSIRYRICPDCGDMHDLADWPDNHRRPDEVLAAPLVVSDDMPPGQHPWDMRTYDSKSGWRKANRQGGYIEVGNDPQRLKPKKRSHDKQGITKAIKKAKEKVFGV